jgi:beta-glucanase (GH16 family)
MNPSPRTAQSSRRPAVVAGAFAALVAVQAPAQTKPAEKTAPDPIDKPGWKLIWNDEFDKGDAPDPKKWQYEVGFVRNSEKQYYTKDRRENARIEDGELIIEGRKETFPIGGNKNADYTAASVTTDGTFAFTYGRVEVRAKLPTGRGTWPAIWMLGVNRSEVHWPRCGEIDIMENVGFDPEVVHGTIHTADKNHQKKTHVTNRITVDKPWEDFHVYAIEWDAKKIEWFVDGKKFQTYANDGAGEGSWPFDKPQYLLLNFAIGGMWGGMKGLDETIFPQKFEIDYVRVYQRAGDDTKK